MEDIYKGMYDKLLDRLEFERGSKFMRRRLLPPTQRRPYTPIDELQIEYFERLQDANSLLNDCGGNEPSELELSCLGLLANNTTNAIATKKLGVSRDKVKRMYQRLADLGLAELCNNRRYRPTDKGFSVLGIEPTEPPKQGGKKGQSIYFGRGRR